MRATDYAVIVSFALAAGCSTIYTGSPSIGRGPAVSIEANPSVAPAAGATPGGASLDCAGITSQEGGGSAYLDCVQRHESPEGTGPQITSPF